MPRKGMRTPCFSPRTSSSFSISHHPSPSRDSLSTPRRSFCESMIERSMATAESMITKWNPDTSTFARVTSLFYEDRNEAMDFIKCVNDLQKAMHLMLSQDSSSQNLVRGQNLMQIAMKRLQKEFYQILSTNRAHLDPESVSVRSSRASARSSTSDYEDDGTDDDIRAAGDSISEVEQVSFTAMENLRLIAECMFSAGYGKECVKIYKSIRKSIIDEGIYKLGVEKVSLNQMNKMDWEVQEMKIKTWLNAVKIAVKTLFNGERILCDHVFAASDSMRESCFVDISKDGAALLFGFPEIVSRTKKSSPEKMFRSLDMYTVIADHWPEIDLIFSFESTSTVRSQALNSLIRLSDSVRTMLSDFETLVQKDSSKSPAPGGGIHNLTHTVMNFLTIFADYSNILADIIPDSPPPAKSHLPESFLEIPDSDNTQAPALSIHIAWLILVLLCKLDGKAKHYKDVSLSYLFLANNLQHIISRVRTSNLKYILGDEWITKQEAKVRQFTANYERLGWGHVYSSLPENPMAVMSAGEAKDWFKKFNSSFEEVYRKQSVCIVSDPKLRDEIKVSVVRKLAPVYREFYETHRVTLGRERNLGFVVRYAPDDIENCLSDLFYGNGMPGSFSSSSSSSSSSNRRKSQTS